MVKGNQVPPFKEKVLVNSHVSIISMLINEKQKTVKDTHALDFFCLFPLSSLFISEFDINKYKKASFTTKINKPKNPATKPSILISIKKKQADDLVQLFLRDHRGDVGLNKDDKISNQ